MITKQEAEDILTSARKSGIQFAELFIEDRQECSIPAKNGRIDGCRTLHIAGTGLTLSDGSKRVYLYTSESTRDRLLTLVKNGADMLGVSPDPLAAPVTLTEKSYPNPCPVRIYPGTVGQAQKAELVRDCALQAMAQGAIVRQADAAYFDTDQTVWIANTDGLWASDRRVTERIRLSAVIGTADGGAYGLWDDIPFAAGFEVFSDPAIVHQFAKNTIQRMQTIVQSKPIAPCELPVVLAAGGCGTLWHESCGHSLEAIAIARGASDFVGKIGQQVASPLVTLIDDGTLPGAYGSGAIDDEGHPRQRNVLIENGVLKNYLCDRTYGQMLGLKSTGSGRRQNYTYAAVPRMTNTLLAEGHDNEADIVGDVEDGLFVQSIGGGQGGRQFSLEVKEGFRIRKGKLCEPVSGIMLTGVGIDIIKRIDAVGTRLEMEGGGFCGASSGLVPTTTPQPMVRISHMAVG